MISTLHDFVLNLITDPQARSIFELDPEAALCAAGLGDITPADVQDVVPLVVDYAAVPGLAGLALPTAAVEAEAGATVSATAVAQLQSVTAHLSAGTHAPGDLGNTAAAAGLVIDHSGVAVGVGALSGLGLGTSAEALVEVPLGPDGDLSATLDADVTGIDGAVNSPVNELTGTVYDVADGAGLGSTVTGVGSTVGGLDGTVAGLGDTVFGTAGLGLDTVGSTLHGVTGTVGGVTSGVTGITDGLTAGTGLDHTLTGVTSTVDGLTGSTGLHDVTSPVTGALSGGAAEQQHGPDLSGVTDILF